MPLVTLPSRPNGRKHSNICDLLTEITVESRRNLRLLKTETEGKNVLVCRTNSRTGPRSSPVFIPAEPRAGSLTGSRLICFLNGDTGRRTTETTAYEGNLSRCSLPLRTRHGEEQLVSGENS